MDMASTSKGKKRIIYTSMSKSIARQTNLMEAAAKGHDTCSHHGAGSVGRRDSSSAAAVAAAAAATARATAVKFYKYFVCCCLLYTSDAADE